MSSACCASANCCLVSASFSPPASAGGTTGVMEKWVNPMDRSVARKATHLSATVLPIEARVARSCQAKDRAARRPISSRDQAAWRLMADVLPRRSVSSS